MVISAIIIYFQKLCLGGIAMKFPGRVGQAAAYGAGCWAQQSVAVSTSGNGEYLTKTLFAKECASTLLGSSPESFGQQIDNFFRKNYLGREV